MRARTLRYSITVLALVLASACASSGSGGGGGGGSMLTNAQLLETGETDTYRAVERLRSTWLRPRGQSSLAGSTVVTLFVDGSPRGDVSQLRGIPVTDVEDVEYLSASEAAFRFGTMAGNGGTIAIRSRR